jgi:hypothetical protein
MESHTWTADDDKRQSAALQRVVDTIKDLTRRQVSSVVIFDLDGTLLDNRPRTYRILREIAENFYTHTPNLQPILGKREEHDKVRYGVSATLEALGVSDPVEVDLIEKEWKKRFFTDFYQRFDFPLPGGRHFVDDVHRAGATVCYLTGRDVSMLVGTTESLRQFGFPVGVLGTMTIVKTDISLDDERFKQETVDYLKRLGTIVATFENEPGNANMLVREFPYADTFLLETEHRPDAPPLDERVMRIRTFVRQG